MFESGVDVTKFRPGEDITVVAKPHRKEFPGVGNSTLYKGISVLSTEAEDNQHLPSRRLHELLRCFER